MSDFDMDTYLEWRLTHPPIMGGAEDETEEDGSAESTEAVQETEAADDTPPWGDDFQPERAWQTITNLRGREKELEPDAKAWKRFREDEEFRNQFLRDELGFEIVDQEDTDEEDEDYGEDDQGRDPRVDSLLEWQRQQQAEKEAERFNQDFKEFVGDRELSERAERAIRLEAGAGRMSPKDLKEAIDGWVAYEDQLRAEARDGYRQSKKAAHVSRSGKAATSTPNWSEMSRDQQAEAMADRLRDKTA